MPRKRIDLPPVPENFPELSSPMNLIRLSDAHFWSTFRFVPGHEYKSDTVRLFTTPIGQYGQGFAHGRAMYLADTNLKESGQILRNTSLLVTAVSWDIWGVKADREHLYTTGAWSWDFSHTLVSIAPATTVKIDQHSKVEFNPEAVYGHLRGVYSYEKGLVIPANTHFGVNLSRDASYKWHDEAFVRFHIFGSTTPIEIG